MNARQEMRMLQTFDPLWKDKCEACDWSKIRHNASREYTNTTLLCVVGGPRVSASIMRMPHRPCGVEAQLFKPKVEPKVERAEQE